MYKVRCKKCGAEAEVLAQYLTKDERQKGEDAYIRAARDSHITWTRGGCK
jgi:hypothetical protein